MAEHRITGNDVALHGLTVGASQVETVIFDTNIGTVDIISDGRAAIYYTINGQPPTIKGGNTFVLPAGATAIDTRPAPSGVGQFDTVRLISDGEATVSIQVG